MYVQWEWSSGRGGGHEGFKYYSRWRGNQTESCEIKFRDATRGYLKSTDVEHRRRGKRKVLILRVGKKGRKLVGGACKKEQRENPGGA